MPLDTFLSLKQAAILSTAKGFWDLPQVKKRVLTFVKEFIGIDHVDARHRWMKSIDELLAAWNTYNLPLDLERHLLYAMKEVGQRIFDWSEYIKWQKKYPVRERYTAEDVAMFVSSIRWTPCGIVDEFKTYQKLSEMDPDFDIVQLYRVACMHAVEDQINYLWRRMSKSEQESLEHYVTQNNDCMVAYWKYRRDKNLDALKAVLKEWKYIFGDFSGAAEIMEPYFSQPDDEKFFVDKNMMLVSIHQGLINSVKYFWNRLPEDHNNAKLFDYLHHTLIIYVDKDRSNEHVTNYWKERLARVCVFFISQMNDDHRDLFRRTTTAAAIFEETYKINVSRIEWLLRPAWPWDNFISLGLKDLIQRRKFPTGLAYILLCELTRCEVEQFKGGLVVNGSEIQRLVQETWKSMPRDQRQRLIGLWMYPSNNDGEYYISNLIDARDFETLRIIVNESEMDDFRDHILYDVLEKCNSLIKTDDYQLLEELINQLATSTEERLSFRKRVGCLDYFVRREEYDLADKLVDWQCWKPQLNEHAKILFVIDLKDRFKYEFPPDKWVCALWLKFSKNIDEAMQRSSRFVNWVFMTKIGRDQFIKRQLVTADTKKILEEHKLSTEVIEKFYSWCELAKEEPFYER